MKTITILSAPGEEYEVQKVTDIHARRGELYLMTDPGIDFHRTEEQSQERIKALETELAKLRQQLDAIHSIIDPNYDNCEEYD
jgi:hypothetical protein